MGSALSSMTPRCVHAAVPSGLASLDHRYRQEPRTPANSSPLPTAAGMRTPSPSCPNGESKKSSCRRPKSYATIVMLRAAVK
uniref:Uncharacterized protein n=1 Tax=Arundo donax TaxID=35708 RepID=A0A0A8Y790_ARUDO